MDPEIDRTIDRCIGMARNERAGGEADPQVDAAFEALFRLAEQPRPGAGFTRRVIEAVRSEPLPAGRRPLRRPWVGPARLAAGGTGALVVVYGAVVVLPQVLVHALAGLLALTMDASLWLLALLAPGVDVWRAGTVVSRALAAALTTKEASLALSLTVVVGAFSLAILQWMLSSDKESSLW